MNNIVGRLRTTGRTEQAWLLIRWLGNTAFVFGILTLIALLVESVVHGSIGIRTTMAGTCIVGAAAYGLWKVSLPLLKVLSVAPIESVETIALRVGNAYPNDLRDTLSNALQLTAQNQGSSELVGAALRNAEAIAQEKDFSVIIDKRRPKFALVRATSVLLLLAALPTLFPTPFGAALDRLYHFSKSYMPPAPFTIHVSTMADTVLRGANVAIDVTIKGTLPNEATLFIKDVGADQFVPMPISFDTGSVSRYQLPGINGSIEFYAESAWNEEGVRSDTARIVVLDKPLIRGIIGKVIPPAYTRQPVADFTERAADVTAITGSTISLAVTASKTLNSARIILRQGTDSAHTDTTSIKMRVQGAWAQGSFSLLSNGTYYIELVDETRQTNAQPVRYNLIALADRIPTIALIQPRADVDINASATMPLLVNIADDYGFSALRLKFRLVKSKYAQAEKEYQTIELPLDKNATSLEVGYTWDLSKIGITPEDVYEYYVEVADNDAVSGPKVARTGILRVRMPSLAEVYAEADRTQESIAKDLKQLAKETEQLQRENDELQRELQKQQSQNKSQTQWEDKKKAQDLAKRRQELQQRMEQTADKLEQMTQQLEQHQAISPETLQKYKELQELMRTVKNPEFEQMQKRMQDAMKQIPPAELEKMMQTMKFDEDQFKKNIERTLNLLKRMQAEQKSEELANRAQELAQKQDELRKQTENANANNAEQRQKLSKQQEQLQDELKKLAAESKELEQMMKDLGANMPMDQMQRAMEELNQDQTSQQMQDAQNQMENGEMQNASKQQQQASQNLQRFAQQMQQVKKQMNRNANKEAMQQMQKGMNDLLDVSKQQEELMKQMQGTDQASQQFSKLAQKQQQLRESMKNMANNMMQLSQRSMSVTPEMAQDMGDALQSMQDALQQMQDRNGTMAQLNQQGAMSSMNSAAKRMSEALGQMMQGDGSGQGGEGQNPGMGKGKGQSPFQRLQQLADQQQQINQQMGQMGQASGSQGQGAGSQGGQMSAEQRAQLGRLAQQQGKALQALQELEQQTRDQKGSRTPVGSLEQIAKDMNEVLTDMQTGSVTPQTTLRQERILSRLLNASRSMNERDYEKSRESNSGTDFSRPSPPQLGIQLSDPSSMRNLMDQLRRGYSKDYEALIRMYFEALQRKQLGTGQ